MALQKQKKSLLFDRGLDLKTNPKITDGYLKLDNCALNNLSIDKSLGYEILVTGPTPITTEPRGLVSTADQLVSILNDDVYVYDDNLNRNTFRGPFSYLDRLTTSTTQVLTPTVSYRENYFHSEYGNFEAIGYTDLQSNVRLRVTDTNTQLTLSDIQLGTATNYRILSIVCTSKAVFVYSVSPTVALGPINETIVFYQPGITPISNLGIIAAFTPVTAVGGTPYYPFPDITTEFDDQFIWIFYIDAGGLPKVLLRSQYSSSEALLAPPGGPFTRAITISATPTFRTANMCSLWIPKPPSGAGSLSVDVMLWLVDNQLFIFRASSHTYLQTQTLAAMPVAHYVQSMCVNNITPLTTTFSEDILLLAASLSEYCLETVSGLPFISTMPPSIYNTNIPTSTYTLFTPIPAYWTRGTDFPYVFGTGFVAGDLYSTSDNAYFLMATMPYIGKGAAAGAAPVPPPLKTPATSIHVNYYLLDVAYNMVDHITHYIGTQKILVNTATDYYAVPFGPVITKRNLITNELTYTTVEELQTNIQGGEVTFTNALRMQHIFENARAKIYSAELGHGLYFGASDLKKLTPTTLDEVNFLDFGVVTLGYTAGAVSPETFWAYTVTFEYTDSDGELARSYPAQPYSANIMPATQVSVCITPPLWLETKRNIVVKIWRTTVNSTLYYLLTSFVFNGSTFAVVHLDDLAVNTDAVIQGNEIAYFNGGVLGELPFETFTSMTLHNNRLFTVKASAENTVQYSLPFQPSVTTATSFGLEFFVEPQDGVITQLASLDDKLVIFKQDFIYVVQGDGANALGANSTLTIPFRINSPVGCSEPLSVVRIPDGIMFKSLKGIYLLGRDLSLQYIGAPVEFYNNLTISSASLSLAQNKVEFTTYAGVIMIYDYYYNTWTTENGITLFATANWDSNFYGIDASNNLVRVFPGYSKNNRPYSMTIQTPWIKTEGLQGFQRAYWLLVLGEWKGPSTMRVGISYDYVDVEEYWLDFKKDYGNSYGENLWGTIQPFGSNERSNFEIRFNLPRQKCQAIRFTIRDIFDNIEVETGNSFSLQELVLVYGSQSIAVSVPVSRRA